MGTKKEHQRMRRRTAVIGALLTIVATGGVLSACGGDDSDSSSATTAAAAATTAAAAQGSSTSATDAYGYPASPSSTAAATTAAASATAGGTLQLGDTTLGKVLVDQAGMTLYMFMKDTQGQPSTCVDKCLAAWPAFSAASPTAGTGLDASKLTTIARPDGSPQVAYSGWPLYYYAEDSKPGDVTGQGSNNVWWVVDASGTPVGK
jgi:predicted lipoprotein with Yx(FWY)xxD motif